MEPLQSSEIKAVLDKLRAEYSENSKKNSKVFDLKAFESRLTMILQQREIFLYSSRMRFNF